MSLARFSPDEKTLAVVVGSHTVGFWEINLDQDKAESKVLTLMVFLAHTMLAVT